jgi:hypothetical protein
MLLYLSNNSRPDIAFAVHQCARFSHDPKQSHAVAAKAIGRYLLRTRKEGLIMKPTGDVAVDCYIDADFAGLWRHEDDQYPLCVKSRTGFLISLGFLFSTSIMLKSTVPEKDRHGRLLRTICSSLNA